MGYTTQYSAKFALPLLDQLVAIIQRDQLSALAIVNAYRLGLKQSALNPITEFHFGPGARTKFPWLFLGLAGGGARHIREGEWSPREQQIVVDLDLDVGDFSSEMAQKDAAAYYILLDTIIVNADQQTQNAGPGSAWETALPINHQTMPGGLTSPGAQSSVKEVFIAAYQYGAVNVTGREGPVMRLSMQVLFDLEEP